MLPWFRLADPSAARQITIAHLLHQTSGFSWWDGLGFEGSEDLSPDAIQARVKAASDVHLIARPGERLIYSNINYAILGAVIEAASGQSYEAYLRDRILTPMGLANTTGDPRAILAPGFAKPHRYLLSRPFHFGDAPVGRADAASYLMASTARDMGGYLAAHARGVRNEEGVVSARGFATLQRGAAALRGDAND